ncbi:MAG TPA: EF-hand domain-containing protein [Burkholderiales bacterium]|nr:EF-hand domain-containing protein [Burkholderiales bacterium]
MQASRKIRNARNAFFGLLGFSLAALLLPLPYMNVTASPSARVVTESPSASAGSSAVPVFDLVDRNRDGFIDRKEAQAVPGLPETFDNMDRNHDGRLDRVEFARW